MMLRMLRIPQTLDKTGGSRSKLYADIAAGLMVSTVKLGPRASGLPEAEVDAVLRARIAGKSDEEIRNLVRRLEAARQAAVAEVPQ